MVSSGYSTEGGFQVAETFGVPLAVLLGAGPLGWGKSLGLDLIFEDDFWKKKKQTFQTLGLS